MAGKPRTLRTRVSDVARLALEGELYCLLRRARTHIQGRPSRLPDRFAPRIRPLPPRAITAGVERARIVMAGPSLALEGAPISQMELAIGLKETVGAAPRVIAAKDGPLRARYEAAGVQVTIDPDLTAPAFHPWSYEAQVQTLAGRLSAQKPDLVFVNTMDCFRAVDAAAVAGVPSIWNVREDEDWRDRMAGLTVHVAARALACFEYPERVVFVAEETRRRWSKFDRRGRFTVIPNAIRRPAADPEARGASRAALSLEPDDLMILNVGTLCARKGQIDLAAAIGKRPELASATAAVVGADPDGYGALVLAAARPLDRSRLRLLEPTDDLEPLYAAADVFVCSSRSESSPRVLLEAASAGLPIVTTSAGDAPTRFEDGRTALFYEAGDAQALADQLARVVVHPSEASLMGRAARDDVAPAGAFMRMIEAYAEVIGAAKGASSSVGSS